VAIDIFLLVASLLVILLATELFTNSVEWLGHQLGLNEGALGSILAAVGTAMSDDAETLVPENPPCYIGESTSSASLDACA
jgi:cation:H+ antiporter